MSQATGLPAELAQASLRTVRARDVTAYAHPRAQLARLVERGLLHRLADGYFTVVPQDRMGEAWLPTLEGAAAGIAAADFGEREYALMGLSAARLHRVLPRATAAAYVAAPRRRQLMHLADRAATVRFLLRDIDEIDVEVLRTDLGECLVATPEQTVLDLAHLHDVALDTDVRGAIVALLPRCEDGTLAKIAAGQRLGRALATVITLGGDSWPPSNPVDRRRPAHRGRVSRRESPLYGQDTRGERSDHQRLHLSLQQTLTLNPRSF